MFLCRSTALCRLKSSFQCRAPSLTSGFLAPWPSMSMHCRRCSCRPRGHPPPSAERSSAAASASWAHASTRATSRSRPSAWWAVTCGRSRACSSLARSSPAGRPSSTRPPPMGPSSWSPAPGETWPCRASVFAPGEERARSKVTDPSSAGCTSRARHGPTSRTWHPPVRAGVWLARCRAQRSSDASKPSSEHAATTTPAGCATRLAASPRSSASSGRQESWTR